MEFVESSLVVGATNDPFDLDSKLIDCYYRTATPFRNYQSAQTANGNLFSHMRVFMGITEQNCIVGMLLTDLPSFSLFGSKWLFLLCTNRYSVSKPMNYQTIKYVLRIWMFIYENDEAL